MDRPVPRRGGCPLVTAAPRGRAGAAGDSSALIVELLRELLRQQTQLTVQLRGRAASPVPFAADVALIGAARLGSEMFATSILLTGGARSAPPARPAPYSTA